MDNKSEKLIVNVMYVLIFISLKHGSDQAIRPGTLHPWCHRRCNAYHRVAALLVMWIWISLIPEVISIDEIKQQTTDFKFKVGLNTESRDHS